MNIDATKSGSIILFFLLVVSTLPGDDACWSVNGIRINNKAHRGEFPGEIINMRMELPSLFKQIFSPQEFIFFSKNSTESMILFVLFDMCKKIEHKMPAGYHIIVRYDLHINMDPIIKVMKKVYPKRKVIFSKSGPKFSYNGIPLLKIDNLLKDENLDVGIFANLDDGTNQNDLNGAWCYGFRFLNGIWYFTDRERLRW